MRVVAGERFVQRFRVAGGPREDTRRARRPGGEVYDAAATGLPQGGAMRTLRARAARPPGGGAHFLTPSGAGPYNRRTIMTKPRRQELRRPPVFKLGYVVPRFSPHVRDQRDHRNSPPSPRHADLLVLRTQGRDPAGTGARGADGNRHVVAAGVLSGLAYFAVFSPRRLCAAAAALAWASKSNPVYWFKNAIVFFVSLPMLADAQRHGVTHLHADFGSSPATIAWIGFAATRTGFSIRYHSFDIHLNTLAWKDPLRRRKLRDADLVAVVHRDGIAHLHCALRKSSRQVQNDPDQRGVSSSPKQKPLPEPPLVLAAGNFVPAKASMCSPEPLRFSRNERSRSG